MKEYEIPPETLNLLGSLSQIERGLLESPHKCARGERIIRDLPNAEWVTHRFNIIPGRMPGSCHGTLLVVIGHLDDVEKRILEAIEHISRKCPDVTTHVVFWSVWWDSIAWDKHASSFSGTTALLKPFLADPSRLGA